MLPVIRCRRTLMLLCSVWFFGLLALLCRPVVGLWPSLDPCRPLPGISCPVLCNLATILHHNFTKFRTDALMKGGHLFQKMSSLLCVQVIQKSNLHVSPWPLTHETTPKWPIHSTYKQPYECHHWAATTEN